MFSAFSDWIHYLLPSRWDTFCVGICTSVTAFLQVALGGFDASIQALLVIVVVDYLTGTTAALKLREWSSDVGFRGLTKKISIFVLIAFCHYVDVALSIDMLRNGAIIAYTLNESGSIIENIDRLGYGYLIPDWFRDKIKTIAQERKR